MSNWLVTKDNQNNISIQVTMTNILIGKGGFFFIGLANANNVCISFIIVKMKNNIGSNHNSRNDLYIQNLYFFKAIKFRIEPFNIS